MILRCDEQALAGQLHFNYALRELNSWGVGGPCDCFYAPASIDDLRYFLQHCIAPQAAVYFLGLGSNVLIRDGGIRGVVISLRKKIKHIMHAGLRVVADAGASCARLARYCADHGLSGLEFIAGVPGTVGGGLAMNAGAFGHALWDYVVQADTIDRLGGLHRRERKQFSVAYREVHRVAGEWFVRGHFDLDCVASSAPLKEKIHSLLKQRNALQPIGQASCGSVFRNPPGDYAARLIEACGLQAYSIGGAQVSSKHANFFINNGHASAHEIEMLIDHVQQTVLAQTGIQLFPEVHIIGEKSNGTK